MKLSVLDLVPVFAPADPGYALEQAVILAQAAERMGYARYWVAEHHDKHGLACTSPEVLLAHIGARTNRIRIGSGALLLPHYKPMKVAEAFRMLAALYPDRVDLGIGRAPGGSAHASIALSGNFLENVRQLPHSLKALMEFLDNGFEMEGQLVTARPVPAIAPQVWMLGTNKKSADFAAQFGTGYVFGQFMSDLDPKEVLCAYREAFKLRCHTEQPKVIAAVHVVCAETEIEALALAAEGIAWMASAESEEQKERMLAQERKMFVGTPAAVKDQLDEFSEKYEVDEFLVMTHIRNYDSRRKSYELLAKIL
ncbi:MsnO8 family LLM class oxidoreductase [Paenibacillus sp. SYP-B3998]|uniref:MsnO8 family LLM class oxidoreductase n=1 Tax=Paenibacillus sp. SYP-B3998 TaxID=2678564 RepID=A0A6G3ZXN3_9BACL|nr:MsnO8 family LLM class oxidoreductase [Paenibacillus sp. SYP-B3998]NEW06331.1 MsnO8 family LLM class oxidoreductase [Paenibacillus sp. SYP-B3998]